MASEQLTCGCGSGWPIKPSHRPVGCGSLIGNDIMRQKLRRARGALMHSLPVSVDAFASREKKLEAN
jgi:hypothetical protein